MLTISNLKPILCPVLADHDPVVVSLAELALRRPETAAGRFHEHLGKAFPGAATSVYNRSKEGLELHRLKTLSWQEADTKRYKFPQLLNDFSLSLTKAGGSRCQ